MGTQREMGNSTAKSLELKQLENPGMERGWGQPTSTPSNSKSLLQQPCLVLFSIFTDGELIGHPPLPSHSFVNKLFG